MNEEKDPTARQELQALSSSIKNLLAQWFAVGLLDLRRVTWESPGSILEKVIMLTVCFLDNSGGSSLSIDPVFCLELVEIESLAKH